jgi:hypothetical protein
VEAARQDATVQPAGKLDVTGRRSGQEVAAHLKAEASRQENDRRQMHDNKGDATTRW